MERGKSDHTIVLIENYWQGFFQSVIWLVVLAIAIAYAVWIESTAMQWIMGIFWFLMLPGWAFESAKKKRLTADDAIARIQEIKESK